MSMIDHLIRFVDEATARADPVVGQYWTPVSTDNPGSWRGNVTIPNVSVYSLAADGVTRTPYAGWFIVIALPHRDLNLQLLAGNACRLISDRGLANAGNQDFILYTAPDVAPADLAAAHVEPTFAGSRYPFGNP